MGRSARGAAGIVPRVSDWSIRPATEDDLAALLPLYRAYATFYECEPTDEGLLSLCRAVMADPDERGVIFCAVGDGEEILGFATMVWKFSSLHGARIGFLDDLFVDPARRGDGIADALIEACAERAREHGAPAVQWLTQPDNARARAVYDRVGGKPEPLIEYELEL